MVNSNPLQSWIMCVTLLCVMAGFSREGVAARHTLPLSKLDLTEMRQGWGRPQVDMAVAEKPMSIAGRSFKWGVGTHADSVLYVQLDGRAQRFIAMVGVDDATDGCGSVRFMVYADGGRRFDSGVMKGADAAQNVQIDLASVTHLVLVVSSADGGVDYDHADWAEATFDFGGAAPTAIDAPVEEKVMLTPKAGPKSKINGPR